MGQLIGAGCVLVTATHALKLADHVAGLHALDQDGDALQVAVAATHELHITDDIIIVQHHVDLRRAGAVGIIYQVFHYYLTIFVFRYLR